MPTEDHPLEYAEFEGIVPEEQYGAGPEIVWNLGTYRNVAGKPVDEEIRTGHVKVWAGG
ncbi:DNA polymerase ligase (LigD)-like protein [Kribbella antiqua]|uniref:DNA polymerase ligase (LigD)-like protein n=1 Tax=Kribbella antiqua TaxID=2512217 RepID=A0A4R2IF69_9ACTN|nr:DNA polymerase ligase N-terminal domain-containing protein [Kribbella antiqua]TCO42459.1 DNA polymerase ligase (LigD)-like protein [Kribbella antiqua]